MATSTNELMGVVRADGSLELSGKLTVPAGKVRVRVESVEEPARPAESLVEYAERTRRELAAAGHKFMTDAETDIWMEELRDEGDRIDEIYREIEAEKRRG